MRTSAKILLPAIALLALSACKREDNAAVAPAATAAAPATMQAPVTATVATAPGVSESPAPGEHTTFDAKAFAGAFSDANMDVTFAADGTYTLDSQAAAGSAGTWTLEPDARHIRLDPNAKAEDDRVYELVDNDQLKAANGTQVLRRKGSAR
ncbi:hypothetical protein LF41_2497 [Lysobacter dokdonensis DS-58]|uniref:Uncharacterized protein n=1 Tax=Lysobacter dokdonensis DS-58 TaxID=1300345 RepID=A0A0A2WJK0_9GAMM|nr:hypothetical protein [Lysobacter dokdonensis]KGQ19988.1 hypothetical protein LF41_2497 [Lysobacter dokdonensis DS-58]